jgi:hypothetical protein
MTLSPPAADDSYNDDADADPVSDTQSKPRAKNRGWTSDEDAQLTSAVANTSKKKRGEEFNIDWVAVAALFLVERKGSVIRDGMIS